jgi:ABC-type transport system involved in Fe-S cluster assembly fused permease/ATPase subunit
MSIVPQDVILGGTIKKISLTETKATHDEIVLAVKQANALNFIEGFPEQFENSSGERGLSFQEDKDNVLR